jgi:hypothetical protein
MTHRRVRRRSKPHVSPSVAAGAWSANMDLHHGCATAFEVPISVTKDLTTDDGPRAMPTYSPQVLDPVGAPGAGSA